MLPPVVIAIPMFLMYRTVGLTDTHVGLIILYTAFNVSFAVWLMKGFIDEIPKEYEGWPSTSHATTPAWRRRCGPPGSCRPAAWRSATKNTRRTSVISD
jgi:hypothetical protein